MGTQQIVSRCILNIEEIIFGSDFTQRQYFYAVRLAVRRVHKQIPEVPQSLCVSHRLAHSVNVARTLRRVCHIQDITGVRSVLVILTAEQRRRFVQPRGVKRAEVLRQAVQFLVNIRLNQVKNTVGLETVRLFPVLHEPVSAAIHTAPRRF